MEYTQDPQTAYHEYLELCRKNIHTLALHSQNRRTPQGKKEEKSLAAILASPTNKENKN